MSGSFCRHSNAGRELLFEEASRNVIMQHECVRNVSDFGHSWWTVSAKDHNPRKIAITRIDRNPPPEIRRARCFCGLRRGKPRLYDSGRPIRQAGQWRTSLHYYWRSITGAAPWPAQRFSQALSHHCGQDAVQPGAQIAVALNPGKKIAHQLTKARALRG